MSSSKEDLLLTSRFSSVGDIDKHSSTKVSSKDIIEEIATIRGVSRTIHRLYAKYSNGFQGVGWIIDEDINTCMICDREFGFFLRKHHCRSCGNVVCYICSPDFVVIEEMIDLGEQRVCIQCYWGQYPVFASHTRTWEDSDDEEVSSSEKLLASIESSIKSYRFQVVKFYEYDGDVILDSEADWDTIVRCVLRDLHILEDYHHGLNNPNQSIDVVEEELVQENIFKSCVLVDEEGEEISPKIESAKLFWQFTTNYSTNSKHSFLLYVNKGKSGLMETARKGKQAKEKKSIIQQIPSDANTPNVLSISPAPVQSPQLHDNDDNDDSDDSGSDEYDMRINSEHLKLISAAKEKQNLSKITDELKFDLSSSVEDDLNLSLPEIEPYSRRRSLTDDFKPTLADKHRQEVDKILAETKSKKSNMNNLQTNTNRRSSLMDQKRYFLSFQSTGTISTSQYKKQNRRASTGMEGKKEKLSSISKEDAALLALAKKSLQRRVTEDDINLLKVALPPEHLAKIHEWSLTTDTDTSSTTIDEDEEEAAEDGQDHHDHGHDHGDDGDHDGGQDDDNRKGEMTVATTTTTNMNVTEERQSDLNNEERLENTVAVPRSKNDDSENQEDHIVSNLSEDKLEALTTPMSNIVNPQNPQDDSLAENISPPPPPQQHQHQQQSQEQQFPPVPPNRRKSNKFSLSKEDEELLQLARSSFQTNNALTDSADTALLNVTDGEALRLLMTIESTRSASLHHTNTPSKQAVADKIRKLSPADEALLMLARHSIHPVASDSDRLTEYLTKTSELFSIDETRRESENNDDDYYDDLDVVVPRGDRGSMISLKEIHRNALLDAFQSICEYPPSTDNSTSDVSHDGYLTYQKFISWEQIQSVLSEKVLNEEIVLDEFQKMAHKTSTENQSLQINIIKFDQFCDLMERLEILAEELTPQVESNNHEDGYDDSIERLESLDEDNMGIPTDIRKAYQDLIATQSNNSIEGVTLLSLLTWDQLQNAINEQLLSKQDVEDIFENTCQKLSNETTENLQESSKYLNLSQFYQISLELQKKIDVSIGDLNALDKLAVPVMDEQMRLEVLPESFSQNPPTRPYRRSSYRETLGDNLELYSQTNTNHSHSHSNSTRSTHKQRNMSIHSTESFESSVQDTFDQPTFLEIESELSKILITGHLYKQGGRVKNWKKRKFILKGCRLSYYDTKKLKGEFNTRDCEVTTLSAMECNGSQYGFQINGPGRKLLLYANNEEDRVMWMNGIKERIEEQERITQWEEQLGEVNRYQEEYNRTHVVDNGAGGSVGGRAGGSGEATTATGDEPHEGSDDEDEDGGVWNTKHSINSLRVKNEGNDQDGNIKSGKMGSTDGGAAAASIWHQFLDPGEMLICSGEIIKRNKYGMSQKRQLLLAKQLTNNIPPRLFYVDPSSMRVKGEMEWDTQKTPQAEYVNATTFKVIVDSRIFKLTVPNNAEKTAQEWVDVINSTISS